MKNNLVRIVPRTARSSEQVREAQLKLVDRLKELVLTGELDHVVILVSEGPQAFHWYEAGTVTAYELTGKVEEMRSQLLDDLLSREK